MRTYGSTCFETDVQYAPPALPVRGRTSTWPASRHETKMSERRGEKREKDESTVLTASAHENARGAPIGAYWSARSSLSRPRKPAFASNQRRAMSYASSVATSID